MNEETNKKEKWYQWAWRPAVAFSSLIIGLFDFVVAPVLWKWLEVFYNTPTGVWEPNTMANGGVFWIAVGGVLGVTSYSRGKEKINGVAGK